MVASMNHKVFQAFKKHTRVIFVLLVSLYLSFVFLQKLYKVGFSSRAMPHPSFFVEKNSLGFNLSLILFSLHRMHQAASIKTPENTKNWILVA